MSYVTALKATGEQAGIYVTTPGRTNGLGAFIDAGEFMTIRSRVPTAAPIKGPTIFGPTFAPGGGGVGPEIAPAIWFGVKPKAPRYGQQGLNGPLDAIFFKLGLLDVIAQEYPGLTLADAWRAEKGKVDEHKRVLPGLRSATARSILARKLSSISGAIDALAGAMQAPDSQIGKRERDKFAEAILAHNDYTKEWRDAKKQFGFADPGTGEVEGPAPAPTPTGVPLPPAPTLTKIVPAELPWGWIIAGGIAIAAAGAIVGRKTSRRRSA